MLSDHRSLQIARYNGEKMEKRIEGLHHITVLASDPQQNYDFYTKVMGLRFIKKTINFDAPDVYHFYFGDEIGSPGTILTFFPFPDARRGKRGGGEATLVSFAVSKGSLLYWAERLSKYDVHFEGPSQKFGYDVMTFFDPDGMKIELVEDDVKHFQGWETEDLPREYSIRKFFGTTIYLKASEKTEHLLTDVMGFSLYGQEGRMKRFLSGHRDREAKLDILTDPNAPRAMQSAGSIHHIAWRTESDASQLEWLKKLRDRGYYPTDVKDRNYFHSIYFREPGGVLFEIATDNPGFLIDENIDELGESLKLPSVYENRREEIEDRLVSIRHKNKIVIA
jgi:glyoxalase family protein